MYPMQSSAILTPDKSNPASSTNTESKKHLHQRLDIAIQSQDYPQAIHLLNHLIIQEPKHSSHYSNRGLIYCYCQQWNQALSNYNQALILNPNGERIYINRAKCHAAMGRLPEAIADYDCAIDINPYNINARLQQGILLRELKLYDDAIVCFGLALFLGDLKARIYAERGRTHHLDGHWNCAVGDYQQALTILDQSHSPSHSTLLVGQIQAWMSELLDS